MTVLTVDGAGIAARAYTPDELRAAFPEHAVAVQFLNGDRLVRATFNGALLADVLCAAGAVPGAGAIEARSADDFRCRLTWAELDAARQPGPVLVAWAQDGAPLADAGPLRLVVPGDARGRRYLRGLARVTVLADHT